VLADPSHVARTSPRSFEKVAELLERREHGLFEHVHLLARVGREEVGESLPTASPEPSGDS
jgi:hypothetical protein